MAADLPRKRGFRLVAETTKSKWLEYMGAVSSISPLVANSKGVPQMLPCLTG